MNTNPQDFSVGQRAAIVAEWRRIVAEPPPFNPRPYGCLTVIAAIVLFVLLPQIGNKLPPPWGTVLLVVLGLALAGGLFVGVFLGSGVYGRASLRAAAALDALTSGTVFDEDARLRHAVGLIAHAVVSDGPTTSNAIDIDAAKQRLGAQLDYVLAVEAVLAQEIGALPVFSDAVALMK